MSFINTARTINLKVQEGKEFCSITMTLIKELKIFWIIILIIVVSIDKNNFRDGRFKQDLILHDIAFNLNLEW